MVGRTPINVNLSDPHHRISCDGREREWRSIAGFKPPNRRAGPAALPFLTDQASQIAGVGGDCVLHLGHNAVCAAQAQITGHKPTYRYFIRQTFLEGRIWGISDRRE
jgi:hypothetical protein